MARPLEAPRESRCQDREGWNCPVVGTDLVGVISQGPWRSRTHGGASVFADAAGKTVAVLRDRGVDVQVVELHVSRGSTFR